MTAGLFNALVVSAVLGLWFVAAGDRGVRTIGVGVIFGVIVVTFSVLKGVVE